MSKILLILLPVLSDFHFSNIFSLLRPSRDNYGFDTIGNIHMYGKRVSVGSNPNSVQKQVKGRVAHKGR